MIHIFTRISPLLHCSLPHCPPLPHGAALSTPAMSTPATSCRIVHSRNVHSRKFSVPVCLSHSCTLRKPFDGFKRHLLGPVTHCVRWSHHSRGMPLRIAAATCRIQHQFRLFLSHFVSCYVCYGAVVVWDALFLRLVFCACRVCTSWAHLGHRFLVRDSGAATDILGGKCESFAWV